MSTINHPLHDLRSAVDAVAALDPGAMTGQQAAELAGVMAELQSRLEAVRLDALDEVQRSGVWALDGSRSAAA